MARPNPDGKLRLLICGDNDKLVYNVFEILKGMYGGQKALLESFQVLAKDEPVILEENRFEMTWVRTGDEVKQLVEMQTPPYYSAVLYDSSIIGKTEEGRQKPGPKMIAGIRRKDFFLPQMVLGTIPIARAAESARGGALYFADSVGEVERTLYNLFSKSIKIPNLAVVKIGGSTFDHDKQVSNSRNIETLCQILWQIHEEEKDQRGKPLHRTLLTVGAGQHGDVIKDYHNKYQHNPDVKKAFPELIAKALQLNLEQLYQHFGDEKASLLNSGAFYYVNDKKTKIPLIGMAPHYIAARDGIPLQDSDTHTIALAEFFGAERVVLVKRTDGIYNFDPYRGRPFAKDKLNFFDSLKWRFAQRNNRRYDIVTIDDMLSGGFSREGTGMDGKADGSQGHLMEDSALEYLKYCKNVKEICVVHIAPEEMHYHIGGNKYRQVITGETLQLGEAGWRGILEQSVRDAVKEGKCFSKIVK